jgi:hypothetical protein
MAYIETYLLYWYETIMHRRRQTTKTMAISITLPRTLIDEMELELNPEESRSAFIAEAIKAYIEVK